MYWHNHVSMFHYPVTCYYASLSINMLLCLIFFQRAYYASFSRTLFILGQGSELFSPILKTYFYPPQILIQLSTKQIFITTLLICSFHHSNTFHNFHITFHFLPLFGSTSYIMSLNFIPSSSSLPFILSANIPPVFLSQFSDL